MKKAAAYLSTILVFIGILQMLSGCTSTEPSRFYTLNSLGHQDIPSQESATNTHVSVGIGPIEIPDYLDRPQIVTRSGLNELKFAEYDRWAGSLSENIAMTVRENLSVLLATERVFVYPWSPLRVVDYKVAIRIIRLESVPGDHVLLKALWTVSGGKENKELITRVSDYKEKLSAPGYDAIVSAMSRTFASMSLEIAAEIRSYDKVSGAEGGI